MARRTFAKRKAPSRYPSCTNAERKCNIALSMIKSLKKSVEVKTYEKQLYNTTIPLTTGGDGYLECISLLKQGDEDVDRIGAQVMVRSIAATFTLFNMEPDVTDCRLRICLFYDRKPTVDNADTTRRKKVEWEEVFDGIHTNPAVPRIEALYNRNMTGRFQFLYDKVINFPYTVSAFTTKIFIKKKFPLLFRPNPADPQVITECYKNPIYLAVFGFKRNTFYTFAPLMNWNSRIKFTDR